MTCLGMCHPQWTKPSHINHQSRQHPTDLPTGQNLNTIFSIKIPSSGARERAEQFRVLVALEKAPGLIHKTHSSLQSFVTSVPGNLIPSHGTHEHKSCMWYTDIHAGKTPPHPSPLAHSIPSLGMVIHIYNPSTWEDEAGGSGV